MEQKRTVWPNRFFMIAFLVLTFFCWCPLFYGSYGPTKRVLGIPSWAVWAFVFGGVLFVLEWIYLFFTRHALSDEELPDIVSELATLNAETPSTTQEES